MIVKLQVEHHLELLSLKGGYRGSSASTLVKMSNCWKSHAGAHLECAVLFSFFSGWFNRFHDIPFSKSTTEKDRTWKSNVTSHPHI